MTIIFSPMSPSDFDDAEALWNATEHMGAGPGDDRESISSYLERNPGMSFVARDSERRGALAGALLCGHDGRRGILYHLAVSSVYRRMGIGRGLVERAVESLKSAGIRKCNLLVFKDNTSGMAFWESMGFKYLEDRKSVV
jgi:N-acetylglutamate synthase